VEKQQGNSLHLAGVDDPLRGREGTVFDKPAPTGPPTPPVRSIPPHLKKVIEFFEGIIADEGLLLDLCVDRAVGIIEYNVQKRAFGTDLFGENPTPMHYVSLAAPLATELYKQVIASIIDRKDEYARLLENAQEEMTRGARPASTILTP
jgi:hypothetical protein